ncbi:Ferric reductase transmembrane component 4 [Pseudocercospora fuligena]|uniref:ferric-chelate reductase (NADPH) n=1 Tax=Pseudocercospora fuligena TaxID=685502 RepID=A0A8H6RT86_9PEZI|nr:Ferric reductase transmembrane component 4 [Pseudocercospora fuligena]
MDMSGMGHSGHDMGGMTMSGGIFTLADESYAYGFWYGIAGCIGLLTAIRAASILQIRQRLKAHRLNPRSIPSRPTGWLSQTYATAQATTREMLYPQPYYFTGRLTKYFTPLPIGKWLLLAFYWIIILSFLWTGTILKSNDPMYAYKWEKVGFRAAWVTVTQIPFIYLLSCKFNPISILTGISHERFNWLHRWAARTVFLTAIVHWSFFYTEWSLGDIVKMQIKMMPMVKYGFGAWGVITWMVISGLGLFRNLNYELFVIQHIAAAGVLLWLLFVHVPSYARYNIWLSVAFVAFDWGMRIVWGVLRNMHLLGGKGSFEPGYTTRLETLPGDVVRLTIEDADFKWLAGQHAYVMIPGLRPFELHPFTIANAPGSGRDQDGRKLSMLIQARAGFSKSLYKAAQKSPGTHRRYRTFLSGPWGSPPDLSHHETVVLIACSSGASFIIPLLQDLVRRQGCVRNISLHWMIKAEEHCQWFAEELRTLVELSGDLALNLQICVHITRAQPPVPLDAAEKVKTTSISVSLGSSSSDSTSAHSIENDKTPLHLAKRRQSSGLVMKHGGRPTLDSMIREPVEQALGETAVVVCGGLAITAETRTYVAKLSDERAVHKGTGAQGIYLFTETYGW